MIDIVYKNRRRKIKANNIIPITEIGFERKDSEEIRYSAISRILIGNHTEPLFLDNQRDP